jgi:hypothetical protein
MESTARWTSRPRLWVTVWLLMGPVAALGLPAAAQAHGAIDPAASSYEARVSQVPQGTDAKVVDGDLRMWMTASPRTTVTVLDYRGAPYLRFDRAGVFVNQASAMWYLNQVPVQTPPLGLTARTPPRWRHASSGHNYEWHDGRLHALASTARAPGAKFIGRWTVPLRVGGVPAAITGGLYYASDPSPVWFWPIVVVVACVLAALRLRRPSLDQRLARGLAAATLTAFLVAALARQLHGRPGVSAGQLIVLALEFAFAGWAATRMARGGGWFVLFLIAAAGIWEGATLVSALVYGFVLLALPAFPARVIVVACLAGGVALLPVVFRLAERPQRPVRPTGRRRAADAPSESLEPSL